MEIPLKDILELSVEERVRLIGIIWDSIAAEPDAFPITDAQREELDRRIDAYEQNPSDTKSWDEVRTMIEQRE